MLRRRRKSQRRKWALAGLVPIALGAVIQIASRLVHRRRVNQRRMMPPPAAGTSFESTYARIEPGTVPVTAQRGKKPAGKPGSARVYDAPRVPDPARALPPPEKEGRGRFPWLLAVALVLILAGFTVFSMQGSRPVRVQVLAVPGGDAETGRQMLQSWGCGSCHTIPGVAGAQGKVGPRLSQMAEQTYIAGMLPNTPENLIRWIMVPQEIQPGNAMPNTDVSEGTARHMAAYLYSIRDGR